MADSPAATRKICDVFQCSLPTTTLPAQADWATRTVRERVAVLRQARHLLSERAGAVAAAISPQLARSKADTLVTELLPLLEACKFLERDAAKILKPRELGRSGRPLWLGGVQAEVHREPVGHVLVIGPANFPLFLPGVQTLQALAAGNTVTWKPGTGGAAVAEIFARTMVEAGLPAGVLTVTDETLEAGRMALDAKPDKVIFTGSSESGRAVLKTLAATGTPAVVELSGADAIVVTPAADLRVVARAVAFGLHLNGGAVCMSPRRLFASPATMQALRPLLQEELAKLMPVALSAGTAGRLQQLLNEAVEAGAELAGSFHPEAQMPVLVDRARTEMPVTRSDIFAPVLSLLEVESMMHLPQMYAQCDYALTLSVFCGKHEMQKARMIARKLKAGTVLINDVIAPTADPRVPFGGRGDSGYGVTRGAEGLLEMTAVKTLLVRRGGVQHHLTATTDADVPLFASSIVALHGKGWRRRWSGMKALAIAAMGKR